MLRVLTVPSLRCQGLGHSILRTFVVSSGSEVPSSGGLEAWSFKALGSNG